MKFSFHPLDEASAREIVEWKYDPPYDFYHYDPKQEKASIRYMINPENRLYAIRGGEEELVGFCSFGNDAQVPGGDYSTGALDVGLGLRPDWTGKGKGAEVIRETLAFANRKFRPVQFRVSIAAFNRRARKAWAKAGFVEAGEFERNGDGIPFVVLLKKP
jgi:ribosomal-protein-alanine N-acetyltransferase